MMLRMPGKVFSVSLFKIRDIQDQFRSLPKRATMDMDENEETLIKNAYAYLTHKTYPEGCTANEKRVIRKKSLKFQISDTGELLYRHKLVGKVNRFRR